MYWLMAGMVAAPLWAAGNPEDGKRKSTTCQACHGESGVSSNDLWPNLVGQKREYLLKQLRAFHEGVRSDPLMTPVAKMLSEQDMYDLAAYYSQLK